ncbi:MAG: large conductance mechanosensitive channel protein MscL [Betaproteobacteria bacterium]
MSIIREFKEFALKGNVVDLAVGVIIGAAFGKLVESMVGDLIMPVVSMLFGKIDFSNLFVILGSVPEGTARTLDALRKAGVPVLAYGQFLSVTVNFLILAVVIFLMIRQINQLKRRQAAEPPVTPPAAPVVPEEVQLLRQIRDSLQSGPQR